MIADHRPRISRLCSPVDETVRTVVSGVLMSRV